MKKKEKEQRIVVMIPSRCKLLCGSLALRLIRLPQLQLYSRRFSENLPGTSSGIRTLNKKIARLIRNGRVGEARMLFDKFKYRNVITWNSMLSGYVKRREIAKARQLFDEMPERDIVSWNTMVSGYVGCGCVEEGRVLFDKMPDRDVVSWNTMISGYAKNGRMDEALRLFNMAPERNVVSWNAMITGFLHNGDVRNAIMSFKKMPERDGASLSALVSGLVENGELDEAATILLETSVENDGSIDLVHAFNTLIAGYGHRGRIDDARRFFYRIPYYCDRRKTYSRSSKRNIVSWNTMIMCYIKARDMVSARELFDLMMERNTCSWNTIISGYIHMSNIKEAYNLFRLMPNPDVFTWTSIISGFAQMGKLELACDLFERMPQKNKVSWNSIIAAYWKNKEYEGAIDLFRQMQLDGEKPDQHTLSSLLSICGEYVVLRLGTQIHQQVIKIVTPCVPLNNSLITMYARCGAINEARAIFEEMKVHKSVISWNAMIGGYASHGYATEALEVFGLMKQLSVQPTYITFISVLNACSNAGLVEEGRMLFESMVNEFGIEPRVEHFASLVDVLARHGQVEEAVDVIRGMTIKPDRAVWCALLGACKVHYNLKLAQVAAEELMLLEPESSAPYVLLHNMYADLGQWDDATEIQMLMKRNNIKKEAAYSLIDSSSR